MGYGSKPIAAFVAVVQTMPTLMLLLLGETSIGLIAWSVARVVTGVTGTTLTVAPAFFALLHDVVPAKDYDAFVGIAFAGGTFMWTASLLVGAALLKQYKSSIAVVVFTVGLS